MNFAEKLETFPEGYSEWRYNDVRWGVRRENYSNGKSVKLVGRALDGSDYISMNWYRLGSGDLLKPCEMPEAKVRAFVLGAEPIGSSQSAPKFNGAPPHE